MENGELSLLQNLERKLTCMLCLSIYTTPRTLICCHSFCQQCLEGLPVTVQGNQYLISCPSCGTSTELLQSIGPAGLPLAFHFQNLVEVYISIKNDETKCDICATACTSYCKDCRQFLCQTCHEMHNRFGIMAGGHKLLTLDEVEISDFVPLKKEVITNCSVHDLPSKLFCQTCDELICNDCTLVTHKGHQYNTVADSYRKQFEILESSLSPVKEKLNEATNAMDNLSKREKEVREQSEKVKGEIHLLVEKMIEAIRLSERQLTREVDRVVDNKLKVVEGQIESAESSLKSLRDCKELVEGGLEDHQEIGLAKEQMMEHISVVIKDINVEEYSPVEKADVQLLRNDKMEPHHIGDVVCTSVQQCKINTINRHQVSFEDNGASFPLSMELPNSSLLIVPLSSLSCSVVSTDNTPINTTVTTTDHLGVYRIHCSPVIRGTHQVTMKVSDVPLEPTSVVIPFSPYQDSITSVRTIDIEKPQCIAVCDTGNIFVTEDSFIVHDKEGKVLKTFSIIEMSTCNGVAICPDNSLIITSRDHLLQKIDMDGNLIASIGCQGNGPLEFSLPCGVVISPTTGHIYVVDSLNHRVQVLNPDLSFSHTFGSIGSAERQFNTPRHIAIDTKGTLYISDTGNHRIQKFTHEGKFLSQFGTYGTTPGQLYSPQGLAINNNILYIIEHSNSRVSAFTTDGQFISCFGGNTNEFKDVSCLSMDNEGYLYVCDYLNDRIVVY